MTGAATRAQRLRTQVRNSAVGSHLRHLANRRNTPGIDFVPGGRLVTLRADWAEELEEISRGEPHLLTKTAADFQDVARKGHILVAVDRSENSRVVGCIVLWPLGQDESNNYWFELGTFMVRPEYRFGSRTSKAMPIGDTLYQYILLLHRHRNILGTTTNRRAVHTGQRHGMQMVSFQKLPPSIHTATCICPADKMQTDDSMQCAIKDNGCRVRISFQTWMRMGQPTQLSWTE